MTVISDTEPDFNTCKIVINRKGWLLIKNLSADFNYLSFLKNFGKLIPQYDGKIVWNIRSNNLILDAKCSLGSVEVAPHTEYYEGKLLPPKYLALWCLNPASCGGGKISLSDGYTFMSTLHPDERRQLYQKRYLYKSETGLIQLGLGTCAYHCILSHSPYGQDIFRFNTTGMEEGDLDFLSLFRKKFLYFHHKNYVEFLQPKHSLLLWDNYRIIHARSSSFSDLNRHLKRVWIGEKE